MRLAPLVLLLLFLIGASPADASSRLPLSSYRSQGDTKHCWAYAMAHMLESRAQFLTGNSVTIDLEADLMYWVYADRLFERYRLKEPIPVVGMNDGKLKSEDGIPHEFFKAFKNHGRVIHAVKKLSPRSSYPRKIKPFIPFERPVGKRLTSRTEAAFIRKLNRAKSDTEAWDLIAKYLGPSEFMPTIKFTKWFDRWLDLEQVPAEMFGASWNELKEDELVWVSIEKPTDSSFHRWEPIGYADYVSFSISAEEADEVARFSLDQGWPVISVGDGHMWSVVGHSGEYFYHADSGDPKMYKHPSAKGLIGGESLMVMRSVLEKKYGAVTLGKHAPRTHRKIHLSY